MKSSLALACAALLLSLLEFASLQAAQPAGRFLRLWWYQPGIEHGNPVTNPRFRVNAPEAVLHPKFGQRSETKSSGMLQIRLGENLLSLQGVDLALEMWGGHPGTSHRRVTINGRTTYPLPGPEAKHCSHAYPILPLKLTDVVSGHNALQFACDQGSTFWGHFIVEQACLRAELPLDHPDLQALGLAEFAPTLTASAVFGAESFRIALAVPASLRERIAAVDFYGRYDSYDENGDGQTNDWHGFTKARLPVAHLGTATVPPWECTWDLSLVKQQPDLDVRAVVHIQDHPELIYETPPLTGLKFPSRPASQVTIHSPTELPEPFLSRAKRLKTCTIDCAIDPRQIERAELHVVAWDGGSGTLENYFTLNGHPLKIAGAAKHDVLYSRVPLDPAWLKQGANQIELLSDTDHHGIEILLPGPALIIRSKR